jgi:hypothetical protein
MIFLNSIWLFALAALSIPVVLHLWNIKRGKTLKVGSISLITVSSQKKSRSLKLNDLLLLLLRCLLLGLVAFVLAMPFWQRHRWLTVKGWLLIPKEGLKEAYQKCKPTIDSLNKAGYEFHYFDKGFEKTDFSKALADTTIYKNTPISNWSLIQQLDGQIPSTLPVYLFTSNNASHFIGAKPEVCLALNWQTYAPADSANTWAANAWMTNNNEIQIVEGSSKSWATFYTERKIRSGDQQTPFVVRTENGNLTVGIKNSNESVAVDTSTWRFAIYADKNTTDARYVKAALQSIIQFTKHKAVIKQYADAGQIPPHQNWVFWLSANPINHKPNCDNLFAYENGKVNSADSWINDEASTKQKISLYRSITRDDNKGYSIWKDGFGEPVLTLQQQGQTNSYHFYSRFDPAWSDLVWSDPFPKMLMKLIAGQSSGPHTIHDRRMMAAKQIMPVINNEAHVSNKVVERTDLSHYLWLLLALTFAVERWLAHHKIPKHKVDNG